MASQTQMTSQTSSQIAAFLTDVGKRATQLKKQQKTDDIIHFIRDNWRLWTDDRGEMQLAVSQLYRDNDVTVEHLAMLLGIPDGVYFKRVKQVDIARAVLDFPGSGLFDVFMKCIDMRKSAEACLFAVAGKQALVITNMQTDYIPGKMHHFFKSMRNAKDIHLFMATEAAERMSMFRHFD